ncbi:MAG: hypothetical protein N3F09_02705 [Bacteroidia bacterium]|nr:hypothetical protein [Bacteroidia bacterium]
MKKHMFCLFSLICFSIYGQENYVFKNKSAILNAGFGLGGYYGHGWFASGYSQLPYINASLDYSFYNVDKGIDIGLGAYTGFVSWSYRYNGVYYTKSGVYKNSKLVQRWSVFHIGFRPTIHYSLEDTPLDIYGGLMLGYGIATYTSSDPDYFYSGVSYTRLYWGLLAGARYFFKPKFGGYLELGYGYSFLNLGISLKLK